MSLSLCWTSSRYNANHQNMNICRLKEFGCTTRNIYLCWPEMEYRFMPTNDFKRPLLVCPYVHVQLCNLPIRTPPQLFGLVELPRHSVVQQNTKIKLQSCANYHHFIDSRHVNTLKLLLLLLFLLARPQVIPWKWLQLVREESKFYTQSSPCFWFTMN